MRNVAKKGLLTAVATGSVLASTAGYAYAGAEAQGVAAGSPGVASGNSVQVPVEVPINACGNTVDVVGALNPAYGNHCANASGGGHPAGGGHGSSGSSASGSSAPGSSASGSSASGSSASGTAAGSPGAVSGNSIQAPVHVPVNACGNSVDVVGVGNPAFGNACGNESHPVSAPPTKPDDDCPEGHTPHNPPPTHPSTPPSQGPGDNKTTPPGIPPRTGSPSTPPAATPTAQAVPASVRTESPQATASQLASTGAGSTELLGAAGLALLVGGGVLYRRARAGAR
ncbi:chaplin [Kitasatospora sp. RG8]|uniref:chaplin n=1 Tax=Kitasatospora sp. RG8 TaxID=2820815 RepID=UPI001ADEFD29|nr:chaplin [Kitasatospora sp. RG8]MBP0453282.1 chaplin [Kitasatospora sp. RG8]